VAAPLLKAAVPLCADAVTTRLGFNFANDQSFKPEYSSAARMLGFTDTLAITGIAPGSAAERAGLMVGDRILAINGDHAPFGHNAADDLRARLSRDASPVVLKTRRDSVERAVTVVREPSCAYSVVALKDDQLNAFADGKNVFVTSTMLRFTENDDELSTIVGHEIAHNAMHHLDAQKKNSMLGALFGAVLDIAAATQGVNTQGGFTKDFAALGSVVFSQDFEREADYVGLYIVAASGRPIGSAANLWRRLAQESPGSIKFASTHPTTAERFVRLSQWQGEIEHKISAGQPLALALRNGQQSAPLQLARAQPTEPKTSVASGTVAASTRAKSSKGAAAKPPSQTSAALTGTDRRGTPDRPQVAEGPRKAQTASSMMPQSDDRVAVAIVGAPSSDSAQAAAVGVFDAATIAFDRHEWLRAEDLYRRALRLDGSIASYHAALGAVEMVLEKWEEAEAEYTAASLIDVMNQDYRAQLLEARRRKKR
jgi:predicted Zn-dependent protease